MLIQHVLPLPPLVTLGTQYSVELSYGSLDAVRDALIAIHERSLPSQQLSTVFLRKGSSSGGKK